MKLPERVAETEALIQNDLSNTFIYRPLGVWFAGVLSKTAITPNQVSVLCLLSGLIGSAIIMLGSELYLRIIAAVFICLVPFLDIVDGTLARYKNMMSKKGGWLDGVIDRLLDGVFIFAMCFMLFSQTGSPYVFIIGFIIYFAVVMTNVVTVSLGDKDDKYISYVSDANKNMSGFFLFKYIQPSYLMILKDNRTTLFALAIVFNQIPYLLWFFLIIQNIYWVLGFIITWRSL